MVRKVIGLGTAGAMYVFLQSFMKDELYSPLGPVFFAGVMAYYVASSFAALLGMVRRVERPKREKGQGSEGITRGTGRDIVCFLR